MCRADKLFRGNPCKWFDEGRKVFPSRKVVALGQERNFPAPNPYERKAFHLCCHKGVVALVPAAPESSLNFLNKGPKARRHIHNAKATGMTKGRKRKSQISLSVVFVDGGGGTARLSREENYFSFLLPGSQYRRIPGNCAVYKLGGRRDPLNF